MDDGSIILTPLARPQITDGVTRGAWRLLAALGFSAIQVLAMGLHSMRGEFQVLPVNLVLLALSLFVLWGRTSKAPVAAR